MQKVLAVVLEVVGTVFLSVMGFVLHPAAGFGLAGVGFVVFGIALERSASPATADASLAGDEVAAGDGDAVGVGG